MRTLTDPGTKVGDKQIGGRIMHHGSNDTATMMIHRGPITKDMDQLAVQTDETKRAVIETLIFHRAILSAAEEIFAKGLCLKAMLTKGHHRHREVTGSMPNER